MKAQNKFPILALSSLLALTLANNAIAKAKATRFKIDSAGSTLNWVGGKLTGEQHNGQVKVKGGEIEVDGDKIIGGKFEIDMTSITNQDVTKPDYNKKLVDHLKSDDFFSASKHPVATFKITGIKAPPKTSATLTHEVSGMLTIKGISKAVTFPANISVAGDQATADGSLTLDRTLWNVKYRSGKFFPTLGDKLIKDEIKIDMKLTARKQ